MSDTIHDKLAARRESYQQRSLPYKVAYLTAGVLVTLAGIVMLVTPGPAFVLIPIGLGMLSMQFDWAQRLLAKALHHAEKAKNKAADSTTRQKVLTALGTVVLVAAVVGGVFAADIAVPVLNPQN